jgi:hypothetical protein
MNHSAAIGTNYSPASTNRGDVNTKIEHAAQAAHRTVDRIADKATVQVNRLSGTAHEAVNSAADTATSAAAWAATIPDQAKQVQTRFTDSASASTRARPLTAILGALTVGYLLGRLARL